MLAHGGYGGAYGSFGGERCPPYYGHGGYGHCGPMDMGHGGYGHSYGSAHGRSNSPDNRGGGFADPYGGWDAPCGQRTNHGLHNSRHEVPQWDGQRCHNNGYGTQASGSHAAADRWMELLGHNPGPAGAGAAPLSQRSDTSYSDRDRSMYTDRGMHHHNYIPPAMERARPNVGESVSQMPPPPMHDMAFERGPALSNLPTAGSFVATPFDEGGVPLYGGHHQHAHQAHGGPFGQPPHGYPHGHMHGMGGPPPPAGYGPPPPGPGPLCAPPIGVLPLNLRFDQATQQRHQECYRAPDTPVAPRAPDRNERLPRHENPWPASKGEVLDSQDVLESELYDSEIESPKRPPPRPVPRPRLRRGKSRPQCAPCFAGC